MSLKEPTKTPLFRLVRFTISLALAATAFAGAHYAFIDLPAQAAVPMTPVNSGVSDEWQQCFNENKGYCIFWGADDMQACIESGRELCDQKYGRN